MKSTIIEKFVEFSDNEFKRLSCVKACLQNSQDCDVCLRQIHFGRESQFQYDCEKMVCRYVCKNIYKYVTEMMYAYHTIRAWLQRQDSISICSIGCGPATELIAFEIYRSKCLQEKRYLFKGFDTNIIWHNVQQQLLGIFSQVDEASVSFYSDDVFAHYGELSEKPNIIVLNYCLSDSLRSNPDCFESFIDKIINLFRGNPNCCLLINDINLGRNKKEVRFYYDIIIEKLLSENAIIKYEKKYFNDSIKQSYQYGRKWSKSEVLFEVPQSIVDAHSPNTECHSAQLSIIQNYDDSECK